MLTKFSMVLTINLILTTVLSFSVISPIAAREVKQAPGIEMADQADKFVGEWTTTDHSKLKALQQKFESGREITEACLSCHSEAESQLHHSIHWKWLSPYESDGLIGKAGYSINDFCISTNSDKLSKKEIGR